MCVVGSGAGGAVVAWGLAAKGHTVVLVEKGGYHPREDFDQREEVMIPMLYKSSGLQFAVPSGIAVAQGSCVGGSTVVNDAVCFRAPEPVLGWWVDEYRVEGVDPDSMKRYYEEVEKRISVSQVPEYALNRNNLVLKRGSEVLGWASAPNQRNCKDCRECGLCQLGCYYGTKQSMLETYIPDTQAIPGDPVKIYSDASASALVRSGGRVSGVKATVTAKGGRQFQLAVKSKVTVVCAGTVASSVLLLASGINPRGQVGRYVAIHPSPAIIGDFEEEINGNRGIPMAYHCYEFSVLKTGQRGYMLESIFLAPYQFSLPVPGVEYEHKRFMSRYSHYALIGSLLQDEAVGRVSAGGPMGGMLEYSISLGDSKMMLEGMKSAARVLFAAGATKVITSDKRATVLNGLGDLGVIDERGVGGLSIGSAHPQGGNRMSGEGLEESSVVDSHSKVHGTKNLFVCDASIFPTSLGVNPQLTVMALATRLVEHIEENWEMYSGN